MRDLGLDMDISVATKRNWERLKTDPTGKLQSRANKKRSEKRFIPIERCSNSLTYRFINELIQSTTQNQWEVKSVLLTIANNLFKQSGINQSPSVIRYLEEYSSISQIIDLYNCIVPKEFDILGTIYQSLLTEGEKNINGSYYTPKHIVESMIQNMDIEVGGTFLDPCCGSGAFLLCLENTKPEDIYGCDIDEISVMLAKANLLLKYKNLNFNPNIKHLDFLNAKDSSSIFRLNKQYDYIATNPPWGASNCKVNIPPIMSGETASSIFVKSYSLLKENGKLSFLLPASILNVRVHKDLREFILNNGRLERITVFNQLFSGVATNYISLEHSKKWPQKNIVYCSADGEHKVSIDSFYKTDGYTFTLVNSIDELVLNKIKSKGNLSLKNSDWALGIVTGDNEHKLHSCPEAGEEIIYTGKEIQAYNLKPATKYIKFDRSQLQQVAKDCFYRCKEKLVYKFISKKLVFAYDNTGALFLNSANILIPKIPGMSIKTTLAFLNTTIFQYLYIKLFNEVKILKGNLMMMPFPIINSFQDQLISSYVDDILIGKEQAKISIENWMSNFYSLTDEEVQYIEGVVNGTIT